MGIPELDLLDETAMSVATLFSNSRNRGGLIGYQGDLPDTFTPTPIEPPPGCSCLPHNADVAPVPCPRKHALSDCIAASARKRLIDTDSATRKTYPMARGLLDYFPDALAEVAKVSFIGNEKHNPGEDMHHARGKSTDHADCILRHLVGRGGFDGDTRESAALAWRALALLQEELEREMNLPLPRGAKA